MIQNFFFLIIIDEINLIRLLILIINKRNCIKVVRIVINNNNIISVTFNQLNFRFCNK